MPKRSERLSGHPSPHLTSQLRHETASIVLALSLGFVPDEIMVVFVEKRCSDLPMSFPSCTFALWKLCKLGDIVGALGISDYRCEIWSKDVEHGYRSD